MQSTTNGQTETADTNMAHKTLANNAHEGPNQQAAKEPTEQGDTSAVATKNVKATNSLPRPTAYYKMA